MKKNKKERQTVTAEIVMMTGPEDFERICWENSERRAYREAQERERLHQKKRRKELAMLKGIGLLAAAVMVGLAVASVLKAGWWAGIAPAVLAALALEVTGW